jgi:predicted nucleic acid-binding protein
MSADVAYLDASAVVKVLAHEPETGALRSRLPAWLRRASATNARMSDAAQALGLPVIGPR